jgi:Flp pilus assembly protein TadG
VKFPATKKKSGFALIEFTLIAFPIIFLTISIIECSIAMWQFHSMAFAVETTTRYVVTHGRGCTKNGNSCAITLGNVTTVMSRQAPGLDPSKLNLKLTANTDVTTCNPINTCFSSTAQFPNSTDNGLNSDITLVASYPFSNPMPLLWPGSGATSIGSFTLAATSMQRIVF